jgi:transposase-like protein
MPILSYLHQLFDVPTCYAYIHRLRWKDRPLQCPRCQSHDVGSWGDYHYRSGCQRYRCRDCERTFNDLTGTLMHQSKRSLPHWILATFLLCLTCSSRRIAREVGCLSGRAIAGAGGCVMPPCRMRWNASWKARSKPMTSTTPPATRAKPKGGQEVVGPPSAWPAQEARARPRPLRQRSARHHCLGQPPGWCRGARNTGLYRQDGAEGR